jgi:hypothetical protein
LLKKKYINFRPFHMCRNLKFYMDCLLLKIIIKMFFNPLILEYLLLLFFHLQINYYEWLWTRESNLKNSNWFIKMFLISFLYSFRFLIENLLITIINFMDLYKYIIFYYCCRLLYNKILVSNIKLLQYDLRVYQYKIFMKNHNYFFLRNCC